MRDSSHRWAPRSLPAALFAGLALAMATASWAHEIPTDVTVQAFVKPEGSRLVLLLRVPLEAMRDVEFPLRGQGYLDIAAAQPHLLQAARLWIADAITLYEGARRLPTPQVVAARISLPSDRSFASYGSALLHVLGAPLPEDTELIWEQALLDVLLQVPIVTERSDFSIHPQLARLGLRTTTVLRFLPPDGAERAFQYLGDPGLVRLDPRWHQAARRFVELGFSHILGGYDHLLFLLCLVLPVRRLRPLIGIITSFTVAHSITLAAAAAGLAPTGLWFPPLIEMLIALSIVTMALDNIVGARIQRRWLIAFGFGLVHGFGFSFALQETLQFAGSHLITSLLSFNVGVELGQILVLGLAVPVLNAAFRTVVAERMGTIIVSAILAHSAWHWMSDRASELRQYGFALPALDAFLLAALMRWAVLALILSGALWLLSGLLRWLEGVGRNRRATGIADE